MSLSKLTSNYVDYNAWANTRLVHWLMDQPVDQMYAEVESSFRSLDLTLQHMLRTQRFWTAFVMQQDLSGFNWSVRKGDAANVMAELVSQSDGMRTQFSQFSEADLSTELSLDMPWAKNRLSRYEYIIHVVNHSTFHRGQIVTMARGLGLVHGIPATDYNIYNCLRSD